MANKEMKTLCTMKTEFSADSVEWCPIENFHQIFVCGTYELQKEENESKSQERLGKIYLFSITEDSASLNPIQTINTFGVLDQKWCHHLLNNAPILGVVTSRGYLELYKLSLEPEVTLNNLAKVLVTEDEGVLALSLDWSFRRNESDSTKITISDSKGRVIVYELNNNFDFVKLKSFECHEYEAWITAFDYWNSNIVYSGGDDCLFKIHDLRDENVKIVNRSHNAGVTSMHSHAKIENILITGSYDEIVRIWDSRAFKRSINEKNVSGGVWRLKWNPLTNKHILAACMYGGFRVLNCENFNVMDVITEYKEHESIAYGADWCYKKCKNDSQMIATCSFYDCKLNLSEIYLND